ncbi:hypothetical protein AKO1_008189 [Acrasis kona]|uniref:Uncharacterized protein n=1 Tax=Acrasis kona TaxID=1008807 RepID=A0AAW2YN85_9EUKA
MATKISWSSFGEVKRAIEANTSHTTVKLVLVGYGVTYIPPSRTSLEFLSDFAKDSGPYKERVKVFLIDEERIARKFCDDNEFVVGTPLLQVYYNGKSVRYRYVRKDNVDGDTKSTNILIGQLHSTTIQTIVSSTLSAVNKNPSSENVVVDLDVDVLTNVPRNEEFQSDDDEDDDDDSDTDTGEDTTEEDSESENTDEGKKHKEEELDDDESDNDDEDSGDD